MGKIFIIGVIGNFGSRILEFFFKKVLFNQVVVLVCNFELEKLKMFVKEGIEVYQGDYFDYDLFL